MPLRPYHEIINIQSCFVQREWLQLRHIQLHLLLAAVELGLEMAGQGALNGHGDKGDREPPLARMDARLAELQAQAAKAQVKFSEPRQVSNGILISRRFRLINYGQVF